MTGQTIGKLYGQLNVPKTLRILVIADVNGFELETTPEFQIGKDTKDEAFLAKFPMGQAPSFESSNGLCLAESSAISIYIAELNKSTTLFGKTPEDRAKVMQFIFNNDTQIEKHGSTILYPILGFMKHDKESEELAYTYLDRNLAFYNNELATKEYLVADQLTLADIFFFFNMLAPYKYFLGEERKAKYANVTKFMDKFYKEEKFAKVLVHLDN